VPVRSRLRVCAHDARHWRLPDWSASAYIYQHRTSLRDRMIADQISKRAEAERPPPGTQRAQDKEDPS
jgi:hypothetical protein